MKNKWLSSLAATVVVSIVTVLLPAPVSAMWSWCEVDPVVVIDGHQVTLEGFVGGEEAAVDKAMKGNTWFYVYVPRGVDTKIVSTEPHVKVKICQDQSLDVKNGAVPFTVVLSVNTPKADYPMMMKVVIDNVMQPEANGSTATELKAHFTLP
jgi:hypothetical protein